MVCLVFGGGRLLILVHTGCMLTAQVKEKGVSNAPLEVP